ncbi:MAG TPA: response regulator [Gemmatimonadales bacterium]|nr:response regulator [Gemmatimonadales bacterium]
MNRYLRCRATLSEQPPLIPDLPGARSILLVDDAAIVRRLAFRLLAEAGYRVFEAAGAGEALEVLDMARGQIALVLIDVVMPEVNGVDLAKMVRQKAPEARIVFMSAFPAEVLVREGLRDPNVRFMAKPFTREELLTAVAQGLAGEPERPDRQPQERGRAEP